MSEPVPALVVAPGTGLSTELAADIEAAKIFIDHAKSAATLRAYRADWACFTAWCSDHAIDPMPASPGQVATFLGHRARVDVIADGKPRARDAVTTLARRIAAINHMHHEGGYPGPSDNDPAKLIARALAGARADYGRPPTRKRPTRAPVLCDMIETIEGVTLRPLRDRAILALGMAAALRRSELVALDLADIGFVDEGADVFIAKSKTDQLREGKVIAIPTGHRIRPVAHLQDWIDARGDEPGPLFQRLTHHDELTGHRMSDRAVARLIKAAASKIGLSAADYSGHSLRSGFLTEAAAAGATIAKMQETSRHKTVAILLGYVQDAERYKNHAGESFL